MPELPEVETIANEIRARAAGRRVASAVVTRADFVRSGTADLPKRLAGRVIDRIRREGKRILLDFDDGASLLIHLGMSGRVTFEPNDSPILSHTHVRIQLYGLSEEIRLRDPRRFGGVWYFAPQMEFAPPPGVATNGRRTGSRKSDSKIKLNADSHVDRKVRGPADRRRTLSPLGPDALLLKLAAFKLMCRRRRQIKAMLLDQQIISGMGNIYCDEALFEARIHPLSNAALLDPGEVQGLCRAVRTTLKKAIRFGGSTLRDYVRSDGRSGEFQKIHRVYGREGKPCPRCRGLIVREQIAGRSTHYCPRCQPLPER